MLMIDEGGTQTQSHPTWQLLSQPIVVALSFSLPILILVVSNRSSATATGTHHSSICFCFWFSPMETPTAILSTSTHPPFFTSSLPPLPSPPFSSCCWCSRSPTANPRFFSSFNATRTRPQPQPLLSSSPSLPCTSTIRCATSSAITQITDTQFPTIVLKSDRPVLVEFVADWCGPCRLISPAIEWVAKEYADRLTVVKIDHDANPKLIQEYKVYGLPTLILFKDGQEVPESRREGAITKLKLKEYLDALLDSISVA